MKEEIDSERSKVRLNLEIDFTDKRWNEDNNSIYTDVEAVMMDNCKKCKKTKGADKHEHTDNQFIDATKKLIFAALEEYVNVRAYAYEVTIDRIVIDSDAVKGSGRNLISMSVKQGDQSPTEIEDQEFKIGETFAL